MTIGDKIRIIEDKKTVGVIINDNDPIVSCHYIPRIPVINEISGEHRRGYVTGKLLYQVFIIRKNKLEIYDK